MKQRILKSIAALALSAALIIPAGGSGMTVNASAEHHVFHSEEHVHFDTRELAGKVEAPTASKKSGTLKCSGNSASVKLTAGSGAAIYYSLNGADYKKASSGVKVKLTKNSTLKVYALKGGAKSSVVTYNYKLKPKLSFKTSESGSGKTVKISTKTSGVTIYYTTDGSKPTTSSNKYTSSGITLTKTSTVKALAVKSGWTDATYSKKVTVSSSSSSGGSDSTESGGAASSSGKVVTKGSKTVKCQACYSLGTCQECYGLGQTSYPIVGYMDCKVCGGSGKCGVCGGNGEVTVEANIINEDAVPEGKEFKKCTGCNGSGLCYLCNGMKMFGGKNCYNCNGTGICTSCKGSGGELKDKPKPEPKPDPKPSTGGGSSGGTVTPTPSPAPSPGLNICFACNGTKRCNYCNGLRRCPTCFGKGGRSVPTYGTGGNDWVNCTACHGTGKCKRCGGNGRCTTCGGF